MGNGGVGHRHGVLHLLGQIPQPGAQDQGCPGDKGAQLSPEIGGAFLIMGKGVRHRLPSCQNLPEYECITS